MFMVILSENEGGFADFSKSLTPANSKLKKSNNSTSLFFKFLYWILSLQ
jgi:hypothetical protein